MLRLTSARQAPYKDVHRADGNVLFLLVGGGFSRSLFKIDPPGATHGI